MLRACLTLILVVFQRMNSRSANRQRRGGAAARGNKNQAQAPTEGVTMPLYLAGLTDAEVGAYLAQMAHDFMMQAQNMTTKINKQDV